MSSSYPSPETIVRHKLANGITVLVYENHNSPSAVVSGYLWAGSVCETAEQAGLASLTARALLRGTDSRTFGQINEALESVGAQLGLSSQVHTAGFGGKALVEDLGLLLEILADGLQRPSFPPAEIEKLKGQVLTSLQRRAYDTRRMAQLACDALLFPSHPYGRSVVGYEETVSELTRDDLVHHYQTRYAPEGMVIAIVGAVTADVALKQVRQALGGWQAPEATPERNMPPTAGLDEQRRDWVTIAGKTQSDIVLGWSGLARQDPDFMKARLANTILGVFGMMGRLGDTVRDQHGLAYYVYSRLQAGLTAGSWSAIAGVDPAAVDRALDGILGEAQRLREELVGDDELADCKSYLTGSLPLQLETNEGLASIILNIERFGLGYDYLQRYTDLVEVVTAGDVQEMAQKYLHPEHYALAVAGPER
jgi:zinc protease